MFSLRCWTRLVIVIAFLSAILVTNETQRGGAQNPRPQPTPTIDLSGKWQLDSAPGAIVVIDHDLATGKVRARFSPALPCHAQTRTTLFDSRLKVTSFFGSDATLSLEDGTIWECTRDKMMVDSCNLTAVWESKTRNVFVRSDGIKISGERFFEWYTWDGIKNRRYENCRRDPSRDSWKKWTLTRACNKDASKIEGCKNLQKAIKDFKYFDKLNVPIDDRFAKLTKLDLKKLDEFRALMKKIRDDFCDNPKVDNWHMAGGVLDVIHEIDSYSVAITTESNNNGRIGWVLSIEHDLEILENTCKS